MLPNDVFSTAAIATATGNQKAITQPNIWHRKTKRPFGLKLVIHIFRLKHTIKTTTKQMSQLKFMNLFWSLNSIAPFSFIFSTQNQCSSEWQEQQQKIINSLVCAKWRNWIFFSYRLHRSKGIKHIHFISIQNWLLSIMFFFF